MQNLEVIIPMIIIYMAVTTFVGAWSVKHTKNTVGWMTAKGQMPLLVIGILLMSEYMAAGTVLGTAETAFQYGISAAWNVITLSIGFLVFAFFIAPKYQQLGEYTIPGALKRYGTGTRTVVSIISIYTLVIISVAAYTGGGVIVATILGISIQSSICLIAALATIAVTFGGMRGVGYANIIHASMKYIGIFAVTITAYALLKETPSAVAAIPDSQWSFTGIGEPKIAAWTLANIGTIIASQYVIQSIAGVKNAKDAKKVSIIASLAILPAGLLSAYIGVSAKALFPTIKGIQAFPIFIQHMGAFPAAIVSTGMIAVTFVTVLSCQVGIVALLMKDFCIPIFKPSEEKHLLITRILTFVAGVVPIPFALGVPGLLSTIFLGRILRTSISVVAIFMFYLPLVGRGKSVVLGLTASTIGATIWYFMGNPYGIDPVYLAIFIPALCMIGDRVFFGPNKAGLANDTEKTSLH